MLQKKGLRSLAAAAGTLSPIGLEESEQVGGKKPEEQKGVDEVDKKAEQSKGKVTVKTRSSFAARVTKRMTFMDKTKAKAETKTGWHL